MKKSFQLIPSSTSRGIRGISYETAKEVDIFTHTSRSVSYEGKWKVVKAEDIMWYLRTDNFVCEVTLRNDTHGHWYINAGRRPVYGHINLFKEVLERVKTVTPSGMVLDAGIQQAGPDSWRIREAIDFDITPVYFPAEEIWQNVTGRITVPNIPKNIRQHNPALTDNRIKHKAHRSYMFYCRNRNIQVTDYDLDHMVSMGLTLINDDEITVSLDNHALAIKDIGEFDIHRGPAGEIVGKNGELRINLNFASGYHLQQIANLLGI